MNLINKKFQVEPTCSLLLTFDFEIAILSCQWTILTLFDRMVCQLALRTFHTVKHGEIIRNFWKDLYLNYYMSFSLTMEQISIFSMFKNLFYTEYTFVFASVLLVWDAKIVCVDWVCHTEILRVVGDQGVPIVPQPECC